MIQGWQSLYPLLGQVASAATAASAQLPLRALSRTTESFLSWQHKQQAPSTQLPSATSRSVTTLAYEEFVAEPSKVPGTASNVKSISHPGGHPKASTPSNISHPQRHGSSSGSSSSEGNVALLLHGLLGSSRNWRSFAKHLAQCAAAQQGVPWRVLCLDLRNHGASSRLPGMHPPHDLSAAATDILHFIHHRLGGRSPTALLGHSMGGKVVLELMDLIRTGRAEPSVTVPPQVWVLDSQPGMVTPEQDATTGVAQVIETVHSIPLPVPSRDWLLKELKRRGFNDALSFWLGSNLVQNERGQLVWMFDVQGATAMYNSYRLLDHWHLLEKPPAGTTLHMVLGERSDRFPRDQVARLQATAQAQLQQQQQAGAQQGRFLLHTLPKAGHWLQVDNPAGLHDIILRNMVAQQGQ